MKIKEMARLERPVEKMALLGRESLSNSELLAIVIRSGRRGESAVSLAERLIQDTENGLRGLYDCSLEELTAIDGIGPVKASVIMAAFELGKRVSESNSISKEKIGCVEDVVNIFMERLRYLSKEKFEVLMLDPKGKIIAIENISTGDLTSSPVHPRETFRSAIKRSAAGVIFVHNHPSGDPSPSNDDIVVTKKLIEAGKVLGISVLDHIVIGDGIYYSMKENGIIK